MKAVILFLLGSKLKLAFLFISVVFYFVFGNQLTGTKWNLYSIQNDKENFKYVLYGVNSTIEFGDSICGGNAACNGFGGYYKIEREMVLFGDLSTTFLNCPDDRGIVEKFVHKNLRKLFYKIDSDTLILSDRDAVVLKYVKKK